MRWMIVLAAAISVATPLHAFERDGHRFDPGRDMTEPAPGAPDELDAVLGLLGQWDVTFEVWLADTLQTSAEGVAEITFMNRGHALLERFHCREAGEGSELNTLSFLSYDGSTWVLGTANDYTENIQVSNGEFEGERLVLTDAIRRLGGSTLVHYRTTIDVPDGDAFVIAVDTATDPEGPWKKETRRRYRRRSPEDDFVVGAMRYGEPAPDVPSEARQFDFFIGEWDEAHDLTLPDGRNVKFPVNGTAVHALNGHAVMEFSWYDVDPSLPDAATTIVRIYNRNMRRWECMYATNRFNGVLYFGGVKEGDRIMLHRFAAHAADDPLNQWVFYGAKPDAYSWYANTSRDRGRTWKKTWIIEATRKATDG